MSCEPWCVDHHERVCMSREVAGVTLTACPGERDTVWVDDDQDGEIALTREAAVRVSEALRTLLSG